MIRRGVAIVETFAEAFDMRAARVVITAASAKWARTAAECMTGFATSVIGCKVEAGIEAELTSDETPDGRRGVSVLLFAFDAAGLSSRLVDRIGQTVLTCATTACFDGLPDATERTKVGATLRHFGDRFQASKVVDGRRYWRIPVMDGEFLVDDVIGAEKGVAGGNMIVQSVDQAAGLAAVRRATTAIWKSPGVITPFPGGVARSGSKVGSRYKGLVASTSDPYCPTLRGRVESKLHKEANCAYEIVIDGTSEQTVGAAMAAGMRAAAGQGVVAITAGNYGGKLGKFHFHLNKLLGQESGVGSQESGKA